MVILRSATQGNTARAAELCAKPFCESQTGKSNDWIFGWKWGWYDHNICLAYNLQSEDYAKGYRVGWDKGVYKK